MRAINLELNIEELILDGLVSTNAEGYLVIEAIERELGRLFSEQGIPQSLIENDAGAFIDGAAFDVAPDNSAAMIGLQVAQSIYEGFGQ